MRKDIIELYEPFYQYTKQPSDSPEWRELRDLVDELIEKIDRPKGTWVKVMGDGYMWNCSECGNRVYVDSNGLFPNYCEDCGADMR